MCYARPEDHKRVTATVWWSLGIWVCRGIGLHFIDLCMKNHYQWDHFWAGKNFNTLNQRNFKITFHLLGKDTKIMLMVNIFGYQTQMPTSWYLALECHAGGSRCHCACSSCIIFSGWKPVCFGSQWSACELMIIDAVSSMVGKRSTSFAAQFNYKRTFRTNVSLLISFSDFVLPFCLADVFSLCTHLVISKQLYNGAHFLNKTAHLWELWTWFSALKLQRSEDTFVRNYHSEIED